MSTTYDVMTDPVQKLAPGVAGRRRDAMKFHECSGAIVPPRIWSRRAGLVLAGFSVLAAAGGANVATAPAARASAVARRHASRRRPRRGAVDREPSLALLAVWVTDDGDALTHAGEEAV